MNFSIFDEKVREKKREIFINSSFFLGIHSFK